MVRRRSDRGSRVLPFPVTRAFVAALAALLILAPAAVAQDLPMDLPGDATASSVRADPDTWLVGAKPGRASAQIAKRFDATHFGFAADRRLQGGAQPGARVRRRAEGASGCSSTPQANVLRKPLRRSPDDPLSGPPNNWRDMRRRPRADAAAGHAARAR